MFFAQNLLIVVIFVHHFAVNGLQEQPRRDFVIFNVLFYVLDGGIDRRLVHFFRRDAIVECEAGFRSDLRHHADRIFEPKARAFDRSVNFICVEWFPRAVSLRDGELHKVVGRYKKVIDST